MGKIDKISIDSTEYEIVPEIAPLFNPNNSYSTGDCVIHNAVLYKFTASHTGAWTGNDVTAFEVGSELVRLGSGGSGSGLTESIKTALLACFEKVAWIDEDGQDYYDALYDALYPPADLVSISAVYTQSGTVYDTDTLDSLKSDLVVTAHMSDSSTHTVTNYVLSGTLTEGTSTITVSYGGKTTTFNVAVTEKQTIHITYTQGSIGAGNTDANRVSGVITDLLHFGEESYRLSVADGYSVYPFGFVANNNESSAGTRVNNNVLYTYVVSDSGYVPNGNVDISGTLSANSISLSTNGSFGWKTEDIVYSFAKTGSYDYNFKGLGFLVKKNDESSILPEAISSVVTFELVET